MIIHINRGFFERHKTGKGKFTFRLVQAFQEMGVEFTDDPTVKADIALQVGRIEYESNARKTVLRVGPACIDTNMGWKKINAEKAKSAKKADAIIYQSYYSRKIYHGLVCKPDKPEVIINNGANPNDYMVEPYNSNFGYNYLASTRVWLKQKRLKCLIKSFLLANLDDSCLVVCGDTCGVSNKYEDAHNIMFLNEVSDAVLARLYRLVAKTGAYLHGTYVDACSNSMVEAQVAGCPVICTDQGGTPEILRYGALIQDKQFKYKPVDLNNTPKINREAMADAIRYFALKQGGDKINGHFEQTDDLLIQNVAKRYVDFFTEVL